MRTPPGGAISANIHQRFIETSTITVLSAQRLTVPSTRAGCHILTRPNQSRVELGAARPTISDDLRGQSRRRQSFGRAPSRRLASSAPTKRHASRARALFDITVIIHSTDSVHVGGVSSARQCCARLRCDAGRIFFNSRCGRIPNRTRLADSSPWLQVPVDFAVSTLRLTAAIPPDRCRSTAHVADNSPKITDRERSHARSRPVVKTCVTPTLAYLSSRRTDFAFRLDVTGRGGCA